MKLTKPWTDEDNARLINALDVGVSAAQASAMFKRSIPSIRAQARRLGNRFPTIAEARKSVIELDCDIKVVSGSVPMMRRRAAKDIAIA